MSSSAETIYTLEPSHVTEIVWNINTEDVEGDLASLCFEDFDTEDIVDAVNDIQIENAIANRMHAARTILAMKVQREYPNCTSITIQNGGHDGSYAQISARCETNNDAIYEPFFDDMAAFSDEACAYAIAVFPVKTPNHT